MLAADGWDVTEPDGSGGGSSEPASVSAGGNGGSPDGPDCAVAARVAMGSGT